MSHYDTNEYRQNIPENLSILSQKLELFNSVEGPRVGDYIITKDGNYKRFSYLIS